MAERYPSGDDLLKEEVDAMLGRNIGQARRGQAEKDAEQYLVKGSELL